MVRKDASLHARILIDSRPEIADPVSATMERSQKTQFADAPEAEYHFMVERDGFVEESFFMWSLIPLVGSIDGMYSIVTEVTKQRYGSKRSRIRSFIDLILLGFLNAVSAPYYESVKPPARQGIPKLSGHQYPRPSYLTNTIFQPRFYTPTANTPLQILPQSHTTPYCSSAHLSGRLVIVKITQASRRYWILKMIMV